MQIAANYGTTDNERRPAVVLEASADTSQYENESVDDDWKEQIELPYARDDEPFLELVPRSYPPEMLHEWEPASPVHGNPDEPGYMGKNGKPIDFECWSNSAIIRSISFLYFTPTEGHPVTFPPELQAKVKASMDKYGFNVLASELIPMNRTYPDMRDAR